MRLHKRPSLELEKQVGAALHNPHPKFASPSATIANEEKEALPTPTQPPKKAKESPSNTLEITLVSKKFLLTKMEKGSALKLE